MATASELPIDRNASAQAMAEEIFGAGVTVVDADYTGDNRSSGIYSDGIATSPGVVPGDTGVILSTGRVQDFTNSSGDPNTSGSTSRNTSGENNNPDFNAAAGTSTFDASYLDVTFIPTGNVMTLQFVFASEEYPEFVNSIFQDFVGVWVNDSQVNLTVGDGDVDPSNLNSTTNENLFIDNTNDDYNTEMDGFTVTMTLTMNVVAGQENDIRIGIADVGDSSYDSTLLIAGGSVQTSIIAGDDSTTINPNATTNLDVLSNDSTTGSGTLTITHINGQTAVVDVPITLPTGQEVTLKSDGTFDVKGDNDIENFNFTYTIDDGVNSDTGIVTVTTVPCFVAGTAILTPEGERPVEMLRPGDLVLTRDDGPQPLRWVGSRRVAAEGALAPIHIAAGTFGAHRDLQVSPLHRVLIRDTLAELLFGESEVLVAAKDLVNDRSVRRMTGGTVNYVHLLFDRHQVITSEGLPTESFLPGPQTNSVLEAEIVDEICRIFPELDPSTGSGYSPAARRILKRYEAEVLRGFRQAA